MDWVGEVWEDAARRLIEPKISPAMREYVAALLYQHARSLQPRGLTRRSPRRERCCVVAELIHNLEVVSDSWGRHPHRVVRITGTYPLPWGFNDRGAAIQEVIRLFVEDALRWTKVGTVTVSLAHDVITDTLAVSVVDTRSPTRARRRSLLCEAWQRSPARRSSRSTSVVALRRALRQVELLGGGIEMSLQPRGYTSTILKIPIVPIGPLVHGDDDIGHGARVSVTLPRRELGGRALLVDRAVSTLRSLGMILDAHGVDSVSAPHGALAIEVLRALPCDSLWIDSEDPLVVGGELSTHLRDVGFSGDIVLLSAHRLRRPGLKLVSDWAILSKPLSAAAIRECLARRTINAKSYSRTIPTTAEIETGDARTEGGALRDVITDYRVGLPRVLAELDQALMQGDYPHAERVAHTLKAGTVFGFREVSVVARALEAALQSRDGSAISRARESLGAVLTRICSPRQDAAAHG